MTSLKYFLWPCVRVQLQARHANKTDNREHAKVFALKEISACSHDIVYMHAKKPSETFSKTTATQSVSNSSAFNERFSLGTVLLLNK